jgi:hypothetical protein
VPRRTLRAALRRERLLVVAAPVPAGVGAGLAAAALLLPAIPLLEVGPDRLDPVSAAGPWWVPGTVAALVGCLALAGAPVRGTAGQPEVGRA